MLCVYQSYLKKSDFRVLQVEWFIEKTNEEKIFKEKLIKTKPKQIEFIPIIKRTELGKYFKYADVILGQMRVGAQGGIERDAAYCKKTVISFCDLNQQMNIDGKNIQPPFLPNSKNPQVLADLLDRVVNDKKFCDELAEKEYEYVKKLSNPEKVTLDWEKIFKKYLDKSNGISRKVNPMKLKMEKRIAIILEKIFYKRKYASKNIEGWGKEKYKTLTQ